MSCRYSSFHLLDGSTDPAILHFGSDVDELPPNVEALIAESVTRRMYWSVCDGAELTSKAVSPSSTDLALLAIAQFNDDQLFNRYISNLDKHDWTPPYATRFISGAIPPYCLVAPLSVLRAEHDQENSHTSPLQPSMVVRFTRVIIRRRMLVQHILDTLKLEKQYMPSPGHGDIRFGQWRQSAARERPYAIFVPDL